MGVVFCKTEITPTAPVHFPVRAQIDLPIDCKGSGAIGDFYRAWIDSLGGLPDWVTYASIRGVGRGVGDRFASIRCEILLCGREQRRFVLRCQNWDCEEGVMLSLFDPMLRAVSPRERRREGKRACAFTLEEEGVGFHRVILEPDGVRRSAYGELIESRFCPARKGRKKKPKEAGSQGD